MQKETSSFFERANNWLKNSISIRLFVIGFLLLLLLIPIEMVKDLIREREYRQQDVIREVSSKWGEAQTIKALALTIPYRSYSKVYDKDNDFNDCRVKMVLIKNFIQHLLLIVVSLSY